MLNPPRATRPVLSMFVCTSLVTLLATGALPDFSLIHADDLQVFSDYLNEQRLLHFA